LAQLLGIGAGDALSIRQAVQAESKDQGQ
jgi:hypothetical protein